MHGVAEYMSGHAEGYGLDPDRMYVLGLLHDIGYIGGKSGHEERGSDLLFRLNYDDTTIISWHRTTPQEYMKSFMISDDEIPPELVLLWEADMMVDMSGEDVGFNRRLNGIAGHYGKNSEPYRICSETINWLNKNMQL